MRRDGKMQSAPIELHHFFADVVRTAFAFLEPDYGFHVALVEHTVVWGVNLTRVLYGSENVFMTMDYGDKVPELTAGIGLRDEGLMSRFGLDEILTAQSIDVPEVLKRIVARNERQVRARVMSVAAVAREYGGPALTGDRAFYRELHRIRS